MCRAAIYFDCFTDCYCSVAPWVGLLCVAVVVHDHTLLIFVTVGIGSSLYGTNLCKDLSKLLSDI